MDSDARDEVKKKARWRDNPVLVRRLKKLGAYSFLFFLIKGLLWLIIPVLIVFFGWEAIQG